MRKKIGQYFNYIGMVIALAGWLATVMYYGKVLDGIKTEMEENRKMWDKQLYQNGQVSLIIELVLNEKD